MKYLFLSLIFLASTLLISLPTFAQESSEGVSSSVNILDSIESRMKKKRPGKKKKKNKKKAKKKKSEKKKAVKKKKKKNKKKKGKKSSEKKQKPISKDIMSLRGLPIGVELIKAPAIPVEFIATPNLKGILRGVYSIQDLGWQSDQNFSDIASDLSSPSDTSCAAFSPENDDEFAGYEGISATQALAYPIDISSQVLGDLCHLSAAISPDTLGKGVKVLPDGKKIGIANLFTKVGLTEIRRSDGGSIFTKINDGDKDSVEASVWFCESAESTAARYAEVSADLESFFLSFGGMYKDSIMAGTFEVGLRIDDDEDSDGDLVANGPSTLFAEVSNASAVSRFNFEQSPEGRASVQQYSILSLDGAVSHLERRSAIGGVFDETKIPMLSSRYQYDSKAVKNTGFEFDRLSYIVNNAVVSELDDSTDLDSEFYDIEPQTPTLNRELYPCDVKADFVLSVDLGNERVQENLATCNDIPEYYDFVTQDSEIQRALKLYHEGC